MLVELEDTKEQLYWPADSTIPTIRAIKRHDAENKLKDEVHTDGEGGKKGAVDLPENPNGNSTTSQSDTDGDTERNVFVLNQIG